MLYLLDFPDGEQVEGDFDTVAEARKYAFNLLQRNAVVSHGFSVRLDRMTVRGPESMGQVNLEGYWTREEPMGGKGFFDRLESRFVNWRPITRRSVVIGNDECIMFDADLFTRDGIRNWFAHSMKEVDPGRITMDRVRMMPSFDDEGESCWMYGEGPRSCTFWKVDLTGVSRWAIC